MKNLSFFKKLKRYLVVFSDAFICIIAFLLFFHIEGGDLPYGYPYINIIMAAVLSSLVLIAGFFLFNAYSLVWRYLNMRNMFFISIIAFISLCVNCLMDIFLLKLPLDSGFCGFFICGATLAILLSRIAYCYLFENKHTYTSGKAAKRLLIIGGGDAAVFALKELRQNNKENYVAVGILDDDMSKQNRFVWDVRVLGNTNMIEKFTKEYSIDTILFAIVNISEERKKQLLARCTAVCRDVIILESIFDKLFSKERLEIKKITMQDLLGRKSVLLHTEYYGKYLTDKVVLVTGGGGSIGSELCVQIKACRPKMLIILDIYENNVYDLQQSFKDSNDFSDIRVEIASVRDKQKLDMLFSKYRPQIIFHAAAHKHVPLMETNPEEAVKNNVCGTLNVLTLCEKYSVERFILISTDKAVNPTSVMGATKRICEKMMIAFSYGSNTVYSAVRFGNVLGSNGSVVPIFERQLQNGGPLTVTHPEVTRYFMTVQEAVCLVIAAGSMADGGEIFVLNMGKPVKINDLAENIIRLSGKVPYVDVDIKYIGLRPGEKLYEELLIDTQKLKGTGHKKIFKEHFIPENKTSLLECVDKLICAANGNESDKVRDLIKEIVPEYNRSNGR